MAGSETRQRTKQVKIRFTPEEFNAIAAKLETGTLSMSAYGRMTMLGEPGPRARRRLPADHQALRQMLGHLGRVGNNLNQIARHLNISHRTVEAHRGRLTRKLGATSTGELVALLLGMP